MPNNLETLDPKDAAVAALDAGHALPRPADNVVPQASGLHHVVVVGGGAGGLELVTRLGDKLGSRRKAQVTLIDRARTHLWKPLLHEVAAGSLDIDEHDLDYLAQAHLHHFRYRYGEMVGLDRANKRVRLAATHDEDGRPICWTLYDPEAGDTPAVPGNPDDGSISSPETFSEWFRDVLGTNQSMLVTVGGGIAEDGEFAGMYEINIPQFYPIDDVLLGNDGEHNNFFTFEIVAEFVYDAQAGQTLYFITDDDAWIFVENQLVADLGGINGSSEQWVDMDRLNLTDGEAYRIRIFKADRSDASSRFHLVTNIDMTSVAPPSILAVFD